MALIIQHLSKSYRPGTKALDQLSIEIGTGMFGLLGPNGAGKSTLMRILATLQTPDTGTVTFNGADVLRDPYALRRQLGYLPQSFGVDPRESARSLLQYLAVLKGIASKKQRAMRVEAVLAQTNLTEVQHQPVSSYSGGMKQRFGIAQLLLNQPRLIIVDEPTAGLDPAERSRFLNVLRAVGAENPVFFSTPIVDDVRALCNDMAIISQGRLLRHQPPKAAIASLEGRIWAHPIAPGQRPVTALPYTLLSTSYRADHREVIRVFAEHPPGPHFQPTPPTLEDVYFLTLKAA